MLRKRQAFVWAFFGYTGAGKTTLEVILTKWWRQNNKGCPVIGFDPHEVFKAEKLLDYFITVKDKNWAEILTQQDKRTGKYKFEKFLLILDDVRSLQKSNHTPEEVLYLLGQKRKLGMDAFLSLHNPMLLTERMSYYVGPMSIFYTESSNSDFSNRIPRYATCQKAANTINAYVLDMGGVESVEYRSCYPNFPHIYIKPQSDELEFMNMDKTRIDRLKREGKI